MPNDDSRISIEPDEATSASLKGDVSFADLDGTQMTALLNGIPGALERARLGYAQALAGDSVPLSDL